MEGALKKEEVVALMNKTSSDRFKLKIKLGEGGQGIAATAEDTEKDNKWVISKITKESTSKSEIWQDVIEEARLIMSMKHGNIEPINEIYVTEEDLVAYTNRVDYDGDVTTQMNIRIETRASDPEMKDKPLFDFLEFWQLAS